MRELFVDVVIVVRENGRGSDRGGVERHIHQHTGAESGILSHRPVIIAELVAAEEKGKGEGEIFVPSVRNAGTSVTIQRSRAKKCLFLVKLSAFLASTKIETQCCCFMCFVQVSFPISFSQTIRRAQLWCEQAYADARVVLRLHQGIRCSII